MTAADPRKGAAGALRDELKFLRGLVARPRTTGAISPSGPALHIEEPESTLFLGCYYAVLMRPILDMRGKFEVAGFLRGGPGPPIPNGGGGAPATFAGQVDGSVLTITVSSEFKISGRNTNTYELRFDGATPKNPVPAPCV